MAPITAETLAHRTATNGRELVDLGPWHESKLLKAYLEFKRCAHS